LEEKVNSLFPNQPADKKDEAFVVLGVPAAGVLDLLTRMIRLERNPVGDDVYFVRRHLKDPLELGVHRPAAANDPPGFVSQPPLDIADVALQVVKESVMPAKFGRVDGGDQGNLEG